MIRGRDLVWAYGAQLLNVGSGLILLPFTLRYLSSDELGLWYLFLALGALGQLLELGFQPTIARQVAYVHAGAQNLRPHGLPDESAASLDPGLFADLFGSARRIYLRLTFAFCVLLAFGGSLYLVHVAGGRISAPRIIGPWLIFACGAAIQFSAGLYSGFLQGRGQVMATNQWLAAARALAVGGSIPFLILGHGLWGVAISNALSAILYHAALRAVFFRREHPETQVLLTPAREPVTLVRSLWQGAWRLGAVQVGAFLIMRANLFIASVFLGLGEVAQYGLTLQVLGLLSTLAGMMSNLQMPRMNALQAQGNRAKLKEAFSLGLVGGAVVYLLGALVVAGAGAYILASIGSQTRMLGEPLLLVALVVFFLELLHSLCASYLTTLNRVPFLAAALLSGAAIVAASAAMLKFTGLGLAALVISQGAVQLVYNNWKWPREALRDLGLGPLAAFRLGVAGLRRMMIQR